MCAIGAASATAFAGAAAWAGLPGSSSSSCRPVTSAGAVGDLIQSWGSWGVAAPVALMVVSAATPFPAELVALANGAVYGPGWGTAITWGGGMLGALLTFGSSRGFGRHFARRLVERPHRQWAGEWTEMEGGTTLLIARLIPLVPFFLLNYAGGLTGMGWRTFVWATGFGILPLTVLMTVAGDWLGALHWQIGSAALAWVWPFGWYSTGGSGGCVVGWPEGRQGNDNISAKN